MRVTRAILAIALAAMWLPAAAWAFPERPVVLVVPFAAGGPTDTLARLLAAAMSADLGQQVTVENVGGAGGTLGAARVAKAAADGHTLLFHNISPGDQRQPVQGAALRPRGRASRRSGSSPTCR